MAIVLASFTLASCQASTTAPARASASPRVVTGSSASAPLPTPDGAPTPVGNPVCRSPQEHVYHPQRLVLRDPCTTVSGTIEEIRPESDGDYHILMRVDPQYEGMLNDSNRRNQRGDLVLEIVCGRRATGTAPIAACAGADPSAMLPALNSHVVATGAYVFDSTHGWLELHPVWDVRPG